MPVKSQDQISQIALERFEELMRDMGWSEDIAVAEIFREIGEPLGITKKAVQAWFGRGIPPYQIYNLSTLLGVDAGWLAGQPHVTKEQAVTGLGLYAREVNRERRRSRS